MESKKIKEVGIEDVRKVKYWEHFSDEECQEVLFDAKHFAVVMFRIIQDIKANPERYKDTLERLGLPLLN